MEVDCDHPEPELCQLLGMHIHQGLWVSWNTRKYYRDLFITRSGQPEELFEKFIPENDHVPEDAVRNTPAPSEGPGTELELILKDLGISTKENCGCKAKVSQMNRWGPEICQRKIKQIVQWLVSSANRRKRWTRLVPDIVKKTYCRKLIQEAIDRSKS